jgi:hypothetical protein
MPVAEADLELEVGRRQAVRAFERVWAIPRGQLLSALAIKNRPVIEIMWKNRQCLEAAPRRRSPFEK